MEEKTILVVDDEPHIRKVISDILSKIKNYNVNTAIDGQQAIEILREAEYKYDLIVTDMMMPKKNGYELICDIKKECPKVAAIVLTAHKNDKNVIKCLEIGAFDYILKPISVDKLLQTVRRALERQERFTGNEEEISVKQEMDGWVELTAPTDFEYVERFQKFTSLLGNIPLSPENREDIRVAIDELGQNAVEWGNQDDRTKCIKLSYCIFNDRLVFKIEDEGKGFCPDTLRDPSVDPLQHILKRMEEGKRAGGYGVYITKKLIDEVVYNDKGNIVILTKYFNK
ncbi:MAG: ATP-binding response regulator [Planctomycetota bacterium]|jgi:CheY-like chemotaxis protein/anti-sigma regulatory factor (Ser/Thr protein kinase)